MPVVRYRDVANMPSALIGDDDMTPAEGLRLACELSETAIRLAGPAARSCGVRPHPRLTSPNCDRAASEIAGTDR
ncbi:hypothetical protein BH23ACT10_BH23ACT10_36080 [soil metagenome]